jgi:hypothetical protein
MNNTVEDSRTLRDNLAGRNVAAEIAVPELIMLQSVDVRTRFLSLENETQRVSFLDGIVAKLDGNLGNWARFYEAVEIVREHRPYWKNKGYGSFDEFWHAVAGPCFRSFKELEDMYSFAKTACPELFHLDFDAARKWAQQISALRSIPPLTAHGGVRIKKRHYANRSEAHAAVVQASKWYNAGGNSLEYRLARLKRDRPDIAAGVLSGRYFKMLGTGRIGIDMVEAESDAYGARPAKKRKADRRGAVSGAASASKVASAIRSLAQSSTARHHVVTELSTIRWLVDALLELERGHRKKR